MVVFPNAKINLGLNILRKRQDGYHDISSCFVPVPFTDALEILPAEEFRFTSSGITIPGNDADNLCIKAYQLLHADFSLPPVLMHLHKAIPIGAGLGGGSSDASFALRCLNQMFELNLKDSELEGYAAKLGSDCPFFINNKAAIATGTGTKLTPIAINWHSPYLVLVTPPIHVSTGEAYADIQPQEGSNKLEDILQKKPLEEWGGLLKNDFETTVLRKYPAIAEVKHQLYKAGAGYASMSGSGASVYGLFDSKPNIENRFSDRCTIWQGLIEEINEG